MMGPFNKKIGWALAAVAIAVAARLLLGDVEPARALATLREAQDEWWALPAYLVAYVLLTSLFVPAVLLHMAVGAAYGFNPGIWINLVTFNTAALLQFTAARRVGQAAVTAFLARRGVKLVERLSHEHGLLSAVLIRFVPMPAFAVAAGLGVSPMRARDFALGTLLGGAPFVVVYTYFASALVEGTAGAEAKARWQVLAATAAVLALALAGGWIRAKVRKRQAAKG